MDNQYIIESYLDRGTLVYDNPRIFKATACNNIKTTLYLQYGLVTVNEMAEWTVQLRSKSSRTLAGTVTNFYSRCT